MAKKKSKMKSVEQGEHLGNNLKKINASYVFRKRLQIRHHVIMI